MVDAVAAGVITQNAMFRLYETDHVWTLPELDRIFPAIFEERSGHTDAALAAAAQPKKV
jgi:hypothetical protein